MEALQMTQENRSMQDLGNELSVIHEAYGISYQSIADAAQVNRSYVSTLANRGAAPVGEMCIRDRPEGLEKLCSQVPCMHIHGVLCKAQIPACFFGRNGV